MEYEYFTPPNIEPVVVEGLRWDQELSMLEAQHYVATEDLNVALEAQRQDPMTAIGTEIELTPEDQAAHEQRLANRIADRRSEIARLEAEITQRREAREVQ